MNRISLAIPALICTLSVLASPAHSQQLRRWYSNDHQQYVDGSFESYERHSKQVMLRDENGKSISIPLNGLCASDRRLALRLAKTAAALADDNTDDSAVGNRLPDLTRRIKHERKRKDAGMPTQNLFGIRWTKGIENALVEAHGKEGGEDDRPVFWLRVLGQLDGFM
jgi:hypothetical protein